MDPLKWLSSRSKEGLGSGSFVEEALDQTRCPLGISIRLVWARSNFTYFWVLISIIYHLQKQTWSECSSGHLQEEEKHTHTWVMLRLDVDPSLIWICSNQLLGYFSKFNPWNSKNCTSRLNSLLMQDYSRMEKYENQQPVFASSITMLYKAV